MFALAQTHSAQHDDLFMAQFFAELDKIKMKQCIPKDPLFFSNSQHFVTKYKY